MKKLLLTILLLIMIQSVLAQSPEIDDGTVHNIIDGISISGDIFRGQIILEPSLFDILFTFTGINVAEKNTYSCTPKKISDIFHYTKGRKGTTSGAGCEINQWIQYKGTGRDIINKVLFDELWYKSSNNDLPDFGNYYLNNYDFEYNYICYDCKIGGNLPDSEKGCLTFDNLNCVSRNDASCNSNKWYNFEKECLKHIIPPSSCNNNGNCDNDETITNCPNDCKIKLSNKTNFKVEIISYPEIVSSGENIEVKVKITNEGQTGTKKVETGIYLDKSLDGWNPSLQAITSSNTQNCEPNEINLQTKEVNLNAGEIEILTFRFIVPKACGVISVSTTEDFDVFTEAFDNCFNTGKPLGLTGFDRKPIKINVDFSILGCNNCLDGQLNGDETDTDCGGKDCHACREFYKCEKNSDCQDGNICIAAGVNDAKICIQSKYVPPSKLKAFTYSDASRITSTEIYMNACEITSQCEEGLCTKLSEFKDVSAKKKMETNIIDYIQNPSFVLIKSLYNTFAEKLNKVKDDSLGLCIKQSNDFCGVWDVLPDGFVFGGFSKCQVGYGGVILLIVFFMMMGRSKRV